MNIFGDYSSNMEIIIQKCRFLDFPDQLKLASASVQLNDVLKNYIWKEKYQTLNIFEKLHGFVLENETNETGICLNTNEVQEFQKLYADKVLKLSIKNIELHLEYNEVLTDALHGRMLRKNILNIRQFKNLKSLTYRYMAIPKGHLKQVGEVNPNLEELCLVNCSLDNSMDDLLQDVVVYMKNLKSFSIENFERFRLKYCRFQEILAMDKLEQLQLTAILQPDADIARWGGQSITPPANLKNLNIQITIDPFKWPSNLPACFSSLESLLILTIETVEKLNDNTLAIIAKTCPNLEMLNIRSTDFEDIERFPIASKVTTLTLSRCRGLSCANLRHILTQLKVTTFHSIETSYNGVFEGSRVSPLITSLRVDGINTQKFTFAHRKNNVEYLAFHNAGPNDEKSFSAKSLAWCTRLKVLDIHNGQVQLKTLMLLKSLHRLVIPQPTADHHWPYITGLLQHPSLKKLSVRNCINGDRKLDLDVPSEGFPTNITSVRIPLEVFEMALDFWLDLLAKNINLRQIWCSYKPHDKFDIFLAKLIYHPNFPKSTRSIDINGFVVGCAELKWNFIATTKRLQSQIDNSKCWFDSDIYRIVLSR